MQPYRAIFAFMMWVIAGRLEVAFAQPCAPAWSSMAGGDVNGSVTALIVFDDGSGSGAALYAGGLFTTAGGSPANNIAKWSNGQWSALGSGTSNSSTSARVTALAVFDDRSGGGPALYAAGYFTEAGGTTVNCIAKWNGTQWSGLNGGVIGSGTIMINALAVYDDGNGAALYAGGFFSEAGGVAVNNIAKWNGTQWSPVGSGTSTTVYAFKVFDDGSGPALIAAGDFISAGGVADTRRIAKWNGSQWSPIGTGLSCCWVYALGEYDDGLGSGAALYAAGSFPVANGSHLAKWTGTQWTDTGVLLNPVRALAVYNDGAGDALFAGGNFLSAAGIVINHIGRWNGVQWQTLANGVNGNVTSLAVYDDGEGAALYVGGDYPLFTGGTTGLVRWKGCPVSPPCPADFDHSGAVNVNDLLAVINGWGPCSKCATCNVDVNHDCTVNVSDLLAVINAWGNCPQ